MANAPSLFATLSLSLIVGAASFTPNASAQEVVNIANVRGVQESTYFASVGGWKVIVGAVNGKPAYCAAIQENTNLRLGFDGGQWQVAVPFSAKRGDFVGSMDLDGQIAGTSGISDGKWTFLWLSIGERDALMNGQNVIIEVGKASLSYDLVGSSAAIQKVEECTERRVTAVGAVAGGSAPPSAGGTPPSFKPANSPGSVGATATRGGGYAKTYAKVGGWEIVRVSKDPGHKRLDHCAAWIITGTETGVRIAISDKDSSFGFSGYGSSTLGDVAPLSVWFDNNRSSAESLEARLVADHNGFEWMMIFETNDQPGLFDDALPNSSKINFAYPVDGKNRVASFSLKGTNAVTTKLIDCRDSR